MKVFALLLLLLFEFPNVANAEGSTQWHFDGHDGTPTDHFFRLNPITLPTEFTIETWVKSMSDLTGDWWMSYAIGSANPASNCFIQSSNKLPVGAWAHFVMTWDGSDTKIYIDGVEGNVGSHPVTAKCTESPGSLVFGQEQDTVGGGFASSQSPHIWLDTVAIYDRAYSSSEVAEYGQDKKCVDVNDVDLWGAWYTNDGVDQSGNNRATADIFTDATAVGAYGHCSGTCFHADGTVLLESGVPKYFSELSLGDVVQTSDGSGTFSFNPVLTLPHAKNMQTATFLNLTTETGKSVIMTPDHYIPNCAGKDITADKLVVGDCLGTIDGSETLFEITSVKKSGIYTATTIDKYIVVDGIVASPYSKFTRTEQAEDVDSWYLDSLKQRRGKLLSYLKKSLRGSHA
mmetsp:Transcript_58800/g.101285  ORF Transcript_58800/g.101285 Transcript_58800/m.101285 type:complete len:401 (-) Transcript_58800:204-1406(-)